MTNNGDKKVMTKWTPVNTDKRCNKISKKKVKITMVRQRDQIILSAYIGKNPGM